METLINPEPRKRQVVYEKFVITFPEDVRISKNEQTHINFYSSELIEALAKSEYVKWFPEKPRLSRGPIVEDEDTIYSKLTKEQLKKRERELPDAYRVKIRDREKLIDHLGKQKNLGCIEFANVLKANPYYKSINIEKHLNIYNIDDGVKF